MVGGVPLLLLTLVVGVKVLGGFIFGFVSSLSNQLVLLSLKVPNLDSVFGSDGDPRGLRVEGQTSNDGSSVKFSEGLAAVVEVPDFNLLVLTAGDDEGSLGGGGDGVDVSVVSLEAVLDLERLVVPDFKTSVPSGGSKEATGEVTLGGASAEEPHIRDPVGMALLVFSEAADTLDVPKLDGLVGTSRQNLAVVGGEAAAKHFLGVTHEPFSALSLSKVPKPEGAIPTGRQQMVVVTGQTDVTDEVAVTSQALPWLSKVGGTLALSVELPDDDGLVATAGNEHLGVLILLDGVASGNTGNPTVVALEMSLLHKLDKLLSFGHELPRIN